MFAHMGYSLWGISKLERQWRLGLISSPEELHTFSDPFLWYILIGSILQAFRCKLLTLFVAWHLFTDP
jgi:hypothetical protein